jgi:hypothetical protein
VGSGHRSPALRFLIAKSFDDFSEEAAPKVMTGSSCCGRGAPQTFQRLAAVSILNTLMTAGQHGCRQVLTQTGLSEGNSTRL